MRIARWRNACQPNPLQGFGRQRPRLCLPHSPMNADGFRHLIADGHQRIECSHRLLKNHADRVAAQRIHFALAGGHQIAPLEHDPTRPHGSSRQKSHDRQRRKRFSRSGFADQPQHFTRPDLQRHPIENGCFANRKTQPLDLEKAHAALPRKRGSKRSRSPSPRRFSPSTEKTMASPGTSATCGASAIIVCASASILPQLGSGGWAPNPT